MNLPRTRAVHAFRGAGDGLAKFLRREEGGARALMRRAHSTAPTPAARTPAQHLTARASCLLLVVSLLPF